MSKSLYMHTIAGNPAIYEPGEQIVHVSTYHHITFEQMFVGSLQTIRRQQRKSREWREQQGFDKMHDYGYIRVRKPESMLDAKD